MSKELLYVKNDLCVRLWLKEGGPDIIIYQHEGKCWSLLLRSKLGPTKTKYNYLRLV